MNHIVLAGDSIFDNAAYVVQNQAVIELLTQKVHGDSNATLLAVDGAVTEEVHDQLDKLPTDSCLVAPFSQDFTKSNMK